MGNSWFSLNLKKLNFGLVGTKMASVAMAGGDEAFSNENGRAFERKAQSLPKSSPLTVAKVGCNLKGPLKLVKGTREKKSFEKQGSLQSEEVFAVGKGKGVSVDPVVQTRGSAKKKVKFGSKKLWTTLFPPTSNRRQGFRSHSEPLLLREAIVR